MSVTALYGKLAISPEPYYRLRRRYQAGGPQALAPRSRRRFRSLVGGDPALELKIVRLRTDWPQPRIRAESTGLPLLDATRNFPRLPPNNDHGR